MSTPSCTIRPDGTICVGRKQLVAQAIKGALTDRALLLFGGRQAGKTTLLRRIELELNAQSVNIGETGDIVLGVYVNLMTLPYDAGPSEFYTHLASRLTTTCESCISGASLEAVHTHSTTTVSMDSFCRDIAEILSRVADRDVRVVFLLDEAKRVLGNRFPRGFQDNLFALLYGADRPASDVMSIVFAGASELYQFCEDDTSPIGSRAAMLIVPNLNEEDVAELVRLVVPDLTHQSGHIAKRIFEDTGGQAGLAAHFVERLATNVQPPSEADIQRVSEELRARYTELFKIWSMSLTNEAQCIRDKLALHRRLSIKDIARLLVEGGYDRFKAQTVFDVLQFVGIAKAEGRELEKVNQMYWDFVSEIDHESGGSQRERDAWASIEQLEVALRSFVRKTYELKWAGQALERMKTIIGEERWAGIERTKNTSARYYRHSPGRPERDIMECMYIGQLGELIIAGPSWSQFQHLFRDKREFQDMLAAISPVRNDRAHFSPVPEKELDRCRIACDDLLVIIRREEGDE